MNVARKFDLPDKAYENRPCKKVAKTTGGEIIYLIGKNNNRENKEVTLEYLNEKLTYFYNNGGPIMDL